MSKQDNVDYIQLGEIDQHVMSGVTHLFKSCRIKNILLITCQGLNSGLHSLWDTSRIGTYSGLFSLLLFQILLCSSDRFDSFFNVGQVSCLQIDLIRLVGTLYMTLWVAFAARIHMAFWITFWKGVHALVHRSWGRRKAQNDVQNFGTLCVYINNTLWILLHCWFVGQAQDQSNLSHLSGITISKDISCNTITVTSSKRITCSPNALSEICA